MEKETFWSREQSQATIQYFHNHDQIITTTLQSDENAEWRACIHHYTFWLYFSPLRVIWGVNRAKILPFADPLQNDSKIFRIDDPLVLGD